jgi:hypothetical protein
MAAFRSIKTAFFFIFSIILILSLSLPQRSVQATTYTVTNTLDSGAGSLRQAIENANAHAGADFIGFNIPPTDPGYEAFDEGVFTITITSTLLISDDHTTIDGYISGNNNPGGLEIEVYGATQSFPIFTITSNDNVIEYLIITWGSVGIKLADDANDNLVMGNYIGLDGDGTGLEPNVIGIQVIGGSDSNNIAGNYISGNHNNGVEIINSNDNILGINSIGTNGQDNDLGNGSYGVNISGTSTGNDIGAETYRNVIAYNTYDGVSVNGATGNSIAYNLIGVNFDGEGDLGNGGDGIQVIGGADNTNIAHNIISNNGNNGVYIEGSGTDGTLITSNIIGADDTGTSALGNAEHGVAIYSGPANTHIQDNIIVANGWSGLVFSNSDGNFSSGNRIGTGSNPLILSLGNTYFGIHVLGDNNIIDSDTVALNGLSSGSDGIQVDGSAYSAIGNLITHVSIYLNGGKGIENIDGGNRNLTGPDLDLASTCTHVSGTVPVGYTTVELYTGPGDEGMFYLGSVTSESSGKFQWSGYAHGVYISATWTDTDSSTSEFSALALPTCYQGFLPMLIKP